MYVLCSHANSSCQSRVLAPHLPAYAHSLQHLCSSTGFCFLATFPANLRIADLSSTLLHCTQVFQLHLSLISQLESLGQVPHWAVFVALHLPDHPSSPWASLRAALVHELVMRHAPFWACNASSREFLLDELHLPATWLEQSLAQWAQYCRDDSSEYLCHHGSPWHNLSLQTAVHVNWTCITDGLECACNVESAA